MNAFLCGISGKLVFSRVSGTRFQCLSLQTSVELLFCQATLECMSVIATVLFGRKQSSYESKKTFFPSCAVDIFNNSDPFDDGDVNMEQISESAVSVAAAASQTVNVSRTASKLPVGMHDVYAVLDAAPEKYLYTPKQDAQLFSFLQETKPLSGDRHFAIVNRQTFFRNFRALTGGLLDSINWENVTVAGGAILACLTHENLEVFFLF